MISAAIEQVHDGALGRLVAHYSTYYTNPVKPMPPESARPAGMGDIEWQVRNWYNFVWLSGDSLVEQAVHNADKIMWVMKDQPPASCVGVGGRSVPANGGNIYDHFEANFVYPNGYRVFLANRQSTGCFNGTLDYVMGTDGTLFLGKGKPRIETPDGKVKWQWEGEEYDMYQREHDVLFASIRGGKPKNDDLNLATSTLLAIMGRDAAYSGQEAHVGAGDELDRQPAAAADGHEREVRGPWSRRPGTHQGLLTMTARLATMVALALVAGAATVPVSTRQPAAAPCRACHRRQGNGRRREDPGADPREGEGRPGRQGLHGDLPNTTATLRHGADSRRHVRDGLGRSRGPEGSGADTQGDARRVLDDDHRGQLGRVPDVHVRRPGQREGRSPTPSSTR